MGKPYQKEMRFYIGIHLPDKEPMYVNQIGGVTSDFFYAEHFTSFEAAQSVGKILREDDPVYANLAKQGAVFVVRSLYVEINGFDLGMVV